MKMADVLHSIADLLDASEEEKQPQPPVIVNVNNGPNNAPIDGDSALDTDKFVPPLQQKIELMKKLAGINSSVAFDDDGPFED